MRKRTNLTDLVPPQDHYYLLRLDKPGKHGPYAFHGGSETSVGLLVFTLLEKAEVFMMQVGKNVPGQIEKVTWTRFLDLAEQAGAVCVVDGTTVQVGRLISESEGGAA